MRAKYKKKYGQNGKSKTFRRAVQEKFTNWGGKRSSNCVTRSYDHETNTGVFSGNPLGKPGKRQYFRLRHAGICGIFSEIPEDNETISVSVFSAEKEKRKRVPASSLCCLYRARSRARPKVYQATTMVRNESAVGPCRLTCRRVRSPGRGDRPRTGSSAVPRDPRCRRFRQRPCR